MKVFRQKSLLVVGPLTLLIGVGIILWPRSSNVGAPAEGEKKNASQEGLHRAPLTKLNYGMLNFHLFETKENKRSWDIQSRFAEFHRQQNYASMEDVLAHFFAQNTGNRFVTRSDYGTSLLDKEVVELRQNVSIRSQQGYVFMMDALIYNGKTHEFHSDEIVRMKGPQVENPKMHLRGKGLMANIDKELFILKSDVSGERQLKNSEWLHIRSVSCEFFSSEDRSVFIDEVHSKLPDVVIDSDVLEIKVKDDENEVLFARGNVELTMKDKKGYAERAFLEVGSGVIILEGKARVISKQNRIEGTRIKMFTDEDRLEVEQAEGVMQQ